jgi:hypothetical protein
MTAIHAPLAPSAEPPVLTEVVGSARIIPTLTNISATPVATSTGKTTPDAIAAADVLRLLDTLVPQLENTLKIQLAAHLDILAKYAVVNAIEELKKDPAALLHAIRNASP